MKKGLFKIRLRQLLSAKDKIVGRYLIFSNGNKVLIHGDQDCIETLKKLRYGNDETKTEQQ